MPGLPGLMDSVTQIKNSKLSWFGKGSQFHVLCFLELIQLGGPSFREKTKNKPTRKTINTQLSTELWKRT